MYSGRNVIESTFLKDSGFDSQDIYSVLRNICFLRGLSQKNLQAFAELCQEREFKKGTLLFLEGEPSLYVFFVRSGLVKVFKQGNNGNEGVIQLVGENGALGAAEGLSLEMHPASAQTLSQCRLIYIDAKRFHKFAKQHAVLYQSILNCANKRYGAFSTFHLQRMNGPVEDRIAMLLILFERNGAVLPSSQVVANLVGCTRETVLRTLSKLRIRNVLLATQPSVKLNGKEHLSHLRKVSQEVNCIVCSGARSESTSPSNL